jgi:hypothetical protein
VISARYRVNNRRAGGEALPKYIIALCFVTIVGGQMASAQPVDAAGTDSSVLVTIPGVSAKDIFLPLSNAISCLRQHGTTCRSYGFPADVLASAYGLNVQGRIFKPERWRIWVPRLEEALVDAKRGSISSDHLPQFGVLDVPGLNRSLYDFTVVRSLVATDLFPYPMRIKYRRLKGIDVPFVELQTSTDPRSGALLAKKCFEEAEKDGSCLVIIRDGPIQHTSTAPAYRDNRSVLLVSFHWPVRTEQQKTAARVEPATYCVTGKQDFAELKQVLTCLKVIVDSQGVDKPIELRSRQGQFDCVPYGNLDDDERKGLEVGGCLYRLNLVVTQSAGGLYDRVKVRVYISDQMIKPCGPPEIDIQANTPAAKFDSYEGCSDHEARFSLRDAALKPDPGSGNSLRLAIYAKTVKTPATKVVVVLLGVDKGLLSTSNPQIKDSYWCWPKSCDDKATSSDMTIVNDLRSQP